jgi:hypothetical protein
MKRLLVGVLAAVIMGGAVPAQATGTVVWESKSLKVTTTIVDSELYVMLHRLVERATAVITVPVFGTTTPATAYSSTPTQGVAGFSTLGRRKSLSLWSLPT